MEGGKEIRNYLLRGSHRRYCCRRRREAVQFTSKNFRASAFMRHMLYCSSVLNGARRLSNNERNFGKCLMASTTYGRLTTLKIKTNIHYIYPGPKLKTPIKAKTVTYFWVTSPTWYSLHKTWSCVFWLFDFDDVKLHPRHHRCHCFGNKFW